MKNLTMPIIHLNGTSKESLLEGYELAYSAIGDTMRTLQEAAPNARDYYPAPVSYPKAADEHAARLKALATVREELEQIARAICNQDR